MPLTTDGKTFSSRASRLGLQRDLNRGKALHTTVPVISAKKYAAAVNLLAIFAEHLSRVSNEIVLRQEHTEPALVSRAKHYIEEHESDHLSLPEVARAVNTTASYLCRLFKRSTGVNFTEYLRRLRLSRAKNLLLNPQLRVSEVAFASGFQSLTQFNRAFQRLMGQSPTEFRNSLRRN
jgi:AraC-like DNA-binding protein